MFPHVTFDLQNADVQDHCSRSKTSAVDQDADLVGSVYYIGLLVSGFGFVPTLYTGTDPDLNSFERVSSLTKEIKEKQLKFSEI